MKNITIILIFLVSSLALVLDSRAQENIWNQNISQTKINLRGEPIVVGQLTVTIPVSGSIVVHFDGSCISDVGDRIILAASDTPTWGVNDGSVGLKATSADVKRNSFSHTRVYDVSAGTHTFYAVLRIMLRQEEAVKHLYTLV